MRRVRWRAGRMHGGVGEVYPRCPANTLGITQQRVRSNHVHAAYILIIPPVWLIYRSPGRMTVLERQMTRLDGAILLRMSHASSHARREELARFMLAVA